MTTENFTELDFATQSALIDEAMRAAMRELDEIYPWPCPTCGEWPCPVGDREGFSAGFWNCPFCETWGTTYTGANAYFVGHEGIRQ